MKTLTKSQFNVLMKQLKQDGELSVSKVLEMASKEDSPLHSLFEWNDEKAANEFRKIQARNVIKQINVKIEEPKEKVVHVPNTSKGEGSYQQAKIVVNNITDFELAMDEALKKLNIAQKAVEVLESVAKKEQPDTTAILAIALKGINTASSALGKIH